MIEQLYRVALITSFTAVNEAHLRAWCDKMKVPFDVLLQTHDVVLRHDGDGITRVICDKLKEP